MINRDIYNWYKNAGLSPWEFNCPHEPECSKGVAEFTSARPPLIGQKYAINQVPRLLIISSDPGKGDSLPSSLGFQLSGPDKKAGCYRQKNHWRETLEIVFAIQRRFDPNLTFEEANACFAHERAVKCCENNPRSREAKKLLFKNCHKYLADELPLFQPDIILTQGIRAYIAVSHTKFKTQISWQPCGQKEHYCHFCVLNVFSDQLSLWIHTYHPTSPKKYYQKYRDGYFNCYPSLAEKFMKNRATFP
jgi:hypothetical protein